MKILHVGVGNLGSGGVASYVKTVVSGQREHGSEVFLAELWPAEESISDVQEILRSLDELAALQAKFRPDVTHLHSQLPSYDKLSYPAIQTAHDHSAHCPSGGRYLPKGRKACGRDFGLLPCLWGHYVDRCGSRNPSAFKMRFGLTMSATSFRGHWVAPSAYTRSWLLRRGLLDSKIHLVANPLTAKLEPMIERPETESIVLFLGRLVEHKGCDLLVRAAADLPPNARIVIGGDGSERPALERLAAELGVSDKIAFEGWLRPEEVHRHLRSARVLVVPSLWPEPFGLVVLEAYAAGLPVVAAATGGLVDLVVDGVTGGLFPPGNHHALSRSLEPFLLSPQYAKTAGEKARRHVFEHYPVVGHLDALERIYRHSMKDAT